MVYKRFVLPAIALLPLSVSAVSGLAQVSAPALEEVIVTAQKRAESLQDTPVSMSAFSSTALEALGALKVSDIAEHTPNLNIAANTISNSGMAVGIRGLQTNDAGLATDSRVGIYLDGVYLARIGSALFDVVDIQQIEVLRGPQGTLWGKNTTGGSINIATVKPAGQFGLRQEFNIGNYNYWRSHTTVDTGEWRGLSAKLAFDRSQRDGDVKNLSRSSDTIGEMDNEAYAIALRWHANSELVVDYSYERHNRDGYGPSLQLSGVNSDLASSPVAQLSGPGGTTLIENPFYVAAQHTSRRMSKAIAVNARKENVDLAGHNLTVSYDLGQAELKSITGFRTYDGKKPADLDGWSYAVPLFEAQNFDAQKQWSQEFQLSGSMMDERTTYVMGLFYFDEETSVANPQTFLYGLGYASGGEPVLTSIRSDLRYKTDNQSAAAYTQLSYTPPVLDDRLRITGGLRYTRDTKEVALLSINTVGKKSWSSLNPSLTVDYQLYDDTNVYAKVSTGYNAGMFNIRAVTPDAFREPVDEENLINYEAGFKSEWLGRRLRINGALFIMDFEDMHVNQFVAGAGGATSMLKNAGEARIKGVELELTARLTPAMQLSAGWGHTDFNYREFITDVDEIAGTNVDAAGIAKPVMAPRNSWNAAIDYSFQPTRLGVVSARIDATYTGAQMFHPFDNDYTKAESRSLVNARISIDEVPLSKGDLRLSLWGKNLTNEEYRVNGIDFGVDSGSLGFAGVIYGPLRSYGVDIVYHYQ